MQQEMLNGLFMVVTVSAVWFPHGVESVHVFVTNNMSSAGSEDKGLFPSGQEVHRIFWVRFFHISVEQSPCVCVGPSVEPFLLAFGEENTLAGLERGRCVCLGHACSGL